MRRGILSLSLPGNRKTMNTHKPSNIKLAEQSANKKEPVVPETTKPVELAESIVTKPVSRPKPPSLLKAVNRRHDEMAARAHKRQQELNR